MRDAFVPFGLALGAVVVAASSSSPARAAEVDPAMRDAETALADASMAFAAGGVDCTTRCKALSSMERAAEKICELAKDGTADDQARCVAAKKKVEDAREILRIACPQCVSDGPPPTVAAPPTTPATKSKTNEDEAPMPAPQADADRLAYASPGLASGSRSVTLRTSLLYPLTSKYTGRLAVEVGLGETVSLGAALGAGKMEELGAYEALVEARAYVLGGFSGGGIAVGTQILGRAVEKVYYDCASDCTTPARTNGASTPGLSAVPFVAGKYVLPIGLTLDAQLGASIAVAPDVDGSTSRRVVPLVDLSIGWSF